MSCINGCGSCDNQLVLCKSQNLSPCTFIGKEHKCPLFKNSMAYEKSPSFAKMMEIYRNSNVSLQHKEIVCLNVVNDLKLLNISLETKSVDMTRSKFKELIELLKNPERKLRDTTISYHLQCFKSLTAEHLSDAYEDTEFDLPKFSIPKFNAAPIPVQEVTDDQARLVEIMMEKWLASGRECDRDAYLYCFLAIYCGLRASDAVRVKWGIFKMTSMGMMIDYVPNKTRKYNKKVSFMINHNAYVKIKPLMGLPDQPILSSHPEKRYENEITKGLYIGMKRSLRNRVNKGISGCGIGNEYRGKKKYHALRKYFETDMAMKYNSNIAAYMACHDKSTQEKYYLGNFANKVS